MLLELPLEEWQAADLRDAGECARETLDLPGARPEGHGSYSEGPGESCARGSAFSMLWAAPPHDNPEMLLESPLEEWQAADRRDAGECARETVDLINRVLECVCGCVLPFLPPCDNDPSPCLSACLSVNS
ncbi:unnamed protein product [Closterium sp. NIES-65]|nr:unnamed protein product [Closterium sp. NIES-65]